MDQTLIRRAEEHLALISGVEKVAIDHGPSGIEAIHVVARGSRRPKQIVRDVVSSLRTGLDLVVDHRKVSVVCMDEEGGPGGHPGGVPAPGGRDVSSSGRVAVRSVSVHDAGDECRAEVVLAHRGREVMGQASAAGGGCALLVAMATVRALERFLSARHRLAVSGVERVAVGGRRVLLVSVSLFTGREEQRLLGSSWDEEDSRRAAVYAALDATNRIFGRLDRRRHVDYVVGPAQPAGGESEADSEESP